MANKERLFYKVVETPIGYDLLIFLDEEDVSLGEAHGVTFPKSGIFTSHLMKELIDDLKASGAIELK